MKNTRALTRAVELDQHLSYAVLGPAQWSPFPSCLRKWPPRTQSQLQAAIVSEDPTERYVPRPSSEVRELAVVVNLWSRQWDATTLAGALSWCQTQRAHRALRCHDAVALELDCHLSWLPSLLGVAAARMAVASAMTAMRLDDFQAMKDSLPAAQLAAVLLHWSLDEPVVPRLAGLPIPAAGLRTALHLEAQRRLATPWPPGSVARFARRLAGFMFDFVSDDSLSDYACSDLSSSASVAESDVDTPVEDCAARWSPLLSPSALRGWGGGRVTVSCGSPWGA